MPNELSDLLRRAGAGLALGAAIGLALAGPALATPTATDITVLTRAQVTALEDHSAASQSTNPVVFPDGPNIIASGASQLLSGGSQATKNGPATSALLVLSANSLSGLGSGIDITFGSLSKMHVTAADFFTGILSAGNNGQVNGVNFDGTGVEHAAVDIAFDSAIPKNTALGSVTIVSPLNLRVDAYADGLVGSTDGLLGRAANSGAEGVLACTNGCSKTPVPEPLSLALLGTGVLGLAMARRRGVTARS